MSLLTAPSKYPPMHVTFRVRLERFYLSYGLDGGGAWGIDLHGVIEASNLSYFETGSAVDMSLHELVDGESHGVFIGSTCVGVNEEVLPEHIFEVLDILTEHRANPGSVLFVDIRSDRQLSGSKRNTKWSMDRYDFLLMKAPS